MRPDIGPVCGIGKDIELCHREAHTRQRNKDVRSLRLDVPGIGRRLIDQDLGQQFALAGLKGQHPRRVQYSLIGHPHQVNPIAAGLEALEAKPSLTVCGRGPLLALRRALKDAQDDF